MLWSSGLRAEPRQRLRLPGGLQEAQRGPGPRPLMGCGRQVSHSAWRNEVGAWGLLNECMSEWARAALFCTKQFHAVVLNVGAGKEGLCSHDSAVACSGPGGPQGSFSKGDLWADRPGMWEGPRNLL